MIGVITRGDKQTAKIYQVSIETTRLPWVTECVELGSILMSRPIQYTFLKKRVKNSPCVAENEERFV